MSTPVVRNFVWSWRYFFALLAIICFVLIGLKVDDAEALKEINLLGFGLAFFVVAVVAP